MTDPAPRTLPLVLREEVGGKPSIQLAGIELRNVIVSGGLTIRYVRNGEDGPDVPEVTMVFGPGALGLDFDVDFLRAMLEAAESA